MRSLLLALIVALMATTAHAQRTRPDTDVGATERVKAHVLMNNDSIVFYPIYDPTTLLVRAYVLWNDSENPVRAHVEFASGDPIDLTAPSESRAVARVLGRGYVMTNIGNPTDENVARFQLTAEQPVRSEGRDFPIPRGER